MPKNNSKVRKGGNWPDELENQYRRQSDQAIGALEADSDVNTL